MMAFYGSIYAAIAIAVTVTISNDNFSNCLFDPYIAIANPKELVSSIPYLVENYYKRAFIYP